MPNYVDYSSYTLAAYSFSVVVLIGLAAISTVRYQRVKNKNEK